MSELHIERERAACADLARGAGCICQDLYPECCEATLRRKDGGRYGFEELEVAEHDPRCPCALALAIESRVAEEA